MLTEDRQVYIRSLDGWCSPEKADCIHNLVVENKPELCVELGVFGSRSLIAFAYGLRDNSKGIVWGIDPWTKAAAVEGEENTENGKWWASLDMDAIRNNAMNAISRAELWPWTRVIVAKGEECGDKFDGIDILHIDGSHTEEKAMLDATLWMPRVKPGGFVIFDDIDWPTTRKAVDWLGERCESVRDVGNCRIYRKR